MFSKHNHRTHSFDGGVYVHVVNNHVGGRVNSGVARAVVEGIAASDENAMIVLCETRTENLQNVPDGNAKHGSTPRVRGVTSSGRVTTHHCMCPVQKIAQRPRRAVKLILLNLPSTRW